MKKGILVLLSLLPVFMGYLINFATLIPGIGIAIFYILSIAVLIFWFILGRQYSQTNWNLLLSAFIGHAVGLLSLFVCIWQFHWLNDTERNLSLAGLSQMFATGTYFLAVRIAMLFQANKYSLTSGFVLNLEIIGLLIMIVLFISGFLTGKRTRPRNQTQDHAGDSL